jgi:type I restriction enzyme M protein
VIRKYLIKDLNYLDAVIGLPSNIFYGTGIPTCILVLKKCREQDENIVFIDASGEGHFIKEGNQNTLRDEDVEMIVNTYRNRETIDKYSNVVSMQEIEENDYNLNIPRYVDTFEEEDDVDLEDVSSEIKKLEKDLSETNSIVLKYCQELNISTPF